MNSFSGIFLGFYPDFKNTVLSFSPHPLMHSGHPPFLQGRLSLQPIFQKGGGGLTGPQLSIGVAGKEGVTFFRGGGGLQFSDKNKLKYEIVNDKKGL